MKNEIPSLKREISSYINSLQNEGPISFSTEDPENNSSLDADIPLYLFFEKEPLAKMGVSYGLYNYYRTEDFFGIDFYKNRDPLVLNAVQRADKKWGVTLMQSFSGKRDLRKKVSNSKINYKDTLMQKMGYFSKLFNFPLEYYLPGNMVFWNLHSINLPSPFECKGRYDIFYENYDYVAKRFGFKLSPDDSLYER